MSISRVIRGLFRGLIDLFFRSTVYHGLHHVPPSGIPTILVIAPHANQFLDPVVVTKPIRRPVGFIAAAKSVRQPYVGWLIRQMNAIPVERPQDLATLGKGFICFQHDKKTGKWYLEGSGGTSFISDFAKPGSSIAIKGGLYV